MEFPPCSSTTAVVPPPLDDTNIRLLQDDAENEEVDSGQRLEMDQLLSHDQSKLDPTGESGQNRIFTALEEQEVETKELVENVEKKCHLLEHHVEDSGGIIAACFTSTIEPCTTTENHANYVNPACFQEQNQDETGRCLISTWGGVAESSNYSKEGCPDLKEKKKKRAQAHLVVWNKDRKKWLQGGPERRRFGQTTTSPDDYTFFRIKVPSAQDLKDKEKGAKSSRCPPDAISNCSRTIKKGRRVTSLKHIDYKKFLQCYIHVQELKNFKADTFFNKDPIDPEPSSINNNYSSSTTTVRRRRVKTGPRQPKTPKMATTTATFVECPLSSSNGFEQLDVIEGSYHTLTSATATLGLVNEFDTQIMSIDPSNPEEAFTVDLGGIDDVANFEQVDLVDSFHVSASPPRRNEFGTMEITFDETGKPRCTYTDLIEKALSENGGLTVSEIYQWISDHYPFFKPDDDRWKNSVRHNLSINPYFKKGEKARSGAGHLWTISEESRALRPALRNKDFDIEDLSMCIENDTDRAVANILGQYHAAKNNMEGKVQQPMESNTTEPTPTHTAGDTGDGGLDSLCTPPFNPAETEIQQLHKLVEVNNVEEDKLMDISPVVIEYETNGFPGLVDHGTEFTIDLSQFQFPDTGISFDGDCTFYTL